MEALAAELAAAQPQFGFAWKALSFARQMQDKDALPALERAAHLLPDDPEVHSNLGAALRRAGRLAEAEASCRRALEINPVIAETWNNLGNALQDSGQLEEAVAAFRRALDLKPGFVKPLSNMGNALRDLGKLDEAVASYRRALDLDPRYAEAHTNLGMVLRLQSRADEAEVCCRRALEVDANYFQALLLLAELQSDQGDFAAADELFRRAAALEPDSPEAWAGLAGVRRMTAADAEWLATAQRLVAQRLAPRRELPLRYAMGKYFDDVGDYGSAFEHYHRANELAKIGRPAHDRARFTAGMDRLIRSYDREWLSRTRIANPTERPVFIVGLPRSGTTLAAQILAAHPQVHNAGELPFWNAAASSAAAAVPSDDDTLGTFAEEYLAVLRRSSTDAQRVVDKMPANFLYLGLIHAALPNARIIHLTRHPIDTCLSIYFQNFGVVHSYANDLADLAHYYREYVRVMEHWRRTLPPHAMLEVGYEALVASPEAWSRKLVEFVGLPWDANCLEFHQGGGPVSTFSKWQVRQKISTSSVGRWRNYAQFVGPLEPLACEEPNHAAPPRSGEARTAQPASLERAKTLHGVGRLEEAEREYQELLQADPSNHEAHHHLGIVALQTGRAEAAIAHIGKAVALNPRHAEARANLGTAYLMTERLEEALQEYDITLEIEPRLAGAWRNRGTILQRMGRYEEAAAAFQRCWEIAPRFDFAIGSMFESRRYACDWRDYPRHVNEIMDGIDAGLNVDRPFSFLSVSASPEQQYRCAKLHAAYQSPHRPAQWRGERYDHDKIRVAYVSADYRAHVVMNLMVPILEAHDLNRFHTVGISLAAEDHSDTLRRAKQALTQFINVSGLSDAAAARTIRELEIDIVVDLTGYTAGCRAGIFAHRPAPVQVSYLGYAGTSGAAHFDYLIADSVVIPRDREQFFSECIARLPHCFLPADEKQPIGASTPGRRDLGLPEEGFVFCAFSNAYKFNPPVFDVWMRLLCAIKGSVLWLRDGSAAMRANLERAAAARGVEPGRLVFAAKVPAMQDHLARHRQADLFLDTLPFGAHATARDALWAGLPVLTCLGDAFASRVAGSLLAALNLPELVTDNLEDYEARALELARDRERLAALESRLEVNLRTQPLFNTRLYCRHLEAAFTEMWERARRGDGALSFDVPVSAGTGSDAELGGRPGV